MLYAYLHPTRRLWLATSRDVKAIIAMSDECRRPGRGTHTSGVIDDSQLRRRITQRPQQLHTDDARNMPVRPLNSATLLRGLHRAAGHHTSSHIADAIRSRSWRHARESERALRPAPHRCNIKAALPRPRSRRLTFAAGACSIPHSTRLHGERRA